MLSWLHISLNLINIMFTSMFNFFDKLEDKVRFKLSHYPITFAFLGGFAIVEFWRGVWHLTDYVSVRFSYDPYGWQSSLFSILLASLILLMTGLYVSLFLTSDNIIISGKKGEAKKAFEKTEEEIKEEGDKIKEMRQKMTQMSKDIEEIKNVVSKK